MTAATISKLPQDIAAAMKLTHVWTPDCPVPLERLAFLSSIRYFDFSNTEHADGELVVLDVVAPYVADIFASLHRMRFPIARIRSLHHYNADDILSMTDNNTSCFCHRPIEGSLTPSMHSYGLAIDINPEQNPFIVFEDEKPTVHPKAGWQYLNRHNQKPGMVENLVAMMAQHGFLRWGGRWTTPIDYHHFEVPRAIGELLCAMNNADGRRFFEVFTKHQIVSNSNSALQEKSFEILLKHYKQDSVTFFESLASLLDAEMNN